MIARLLRRDGPARARLGRASLGRAGERAAARRLRRSGFRILGRNVRVDHDEADLVAVDPDGVTLVIVEVKTREHDVHAPELGVDDLKQFRLVRLAAKLQRRDAFADRPIRFDVVAVVWGSGRSPEIRHIPGAFESPW